MKTYTIKIGKDINVGFEVVKGWGYSVEVNNEPYEDLGGFKTIQEAWANVKKLINNEVKE